MKISLRNSKKVLKNEAMLYEMTAPDLTQQSAHVLNTKFNNAWRRMDHQL